MENDDDDEIWGHPDRDGGLIIYQLKQIISVYYYYVVLMIYYYQEASCTGRAINYNNCGSRALHCFHVCLGLYITRRDASAQ